MAAYLSMMFAAIWMFPASSVFEADHHRAVAGAVVRLKGLRPQFGEAGAAFKCLEAVPLGVVRVVAAEPVKCASAPPSACPRSQAALRRRGAPGGRRIGVWDGRPPSRRAATVVSCRPAIASGGAAGVANIDVRRAAQGVGMHRRFHDVHPATGGTPCARPPACRAFKSSSILWLRSVIRIASLLSISSFVRAASRCRLRMAAYFSRCACIPAALLNAA